jgi:hypothetical protein
MTTASRILFTFIFLTAQLLAVVSVPTGANSETAAPGGCESCCQQAEDLSLCPPGSDNELPLDANCCPDGCNNCLLLCCASPMASPGSTQVSDPNLVPHGFILGHEPIFSSAPSGKIDHPPRR